MSVGDELEISQIIKNIVREIVRESTRIPQFKPDENLITFYVKLLLYDPNWQINGEVLRARKNIQRLINYVVENFKHEDEPNMISVKIQHSFLHTFRRRHEIVVQRKVKINKRLNPLRLSILEIDRTDVDLSNIFEKIVVYFVLLSGLGNPMIPGVYKQSRAVLKSVLNAQELKDFVNSPYVIRVEELETMVKVCSGIRIYNWDCGRASEGVPNLPNLLFNAMYGLDEFLVYVHYEIGARIDILTKAIKCCFVTNYLKQKVMLKLQLPDEDVLEEDVKYCIHLTLVYKQFQEAIQYLLDEVTALRTSTVEVEGRFKEILEHLHASVVPNFYIHVHQVFPHFVELSKIWVTFQDTVVLLNIVRQVVEHLDRMVKSLKFDSISLIKYYNKEIPPEAVLDEDSAYVTEMLADPDPECHVYTKYELDSLIAEKGEKIFEYGGHCCWMLVLTNGFLVKGDEYYGIVGYSGRYYIFSSPLALKSFIKDPTYYINHVLHMARERCGLILFLKLTEDLKAMKHELNLIQEHSKDSQVPYAEVACQVEHDTAGYIDRTYHSSLWEYKADALQMGTLSRCKTVSTMTDNIFFTNSMPTQTFFPKDKETMTNSEKYTNTPTPLVFIHGLRNDKEGKKQAQLDLTYWDFRPSYSNKA